MTTNLIIIITFIFITIYAIIILLSIRNCYKYIKTVCKCLFEKLNTIGTREIDIKKEIQKLQSTIDNVKKDTDAICQGLLGYIKKQFIPFTKSVADASKAFQEVYNNNMKAYTKDLAIIVKILNDNVDNIKAIANKVGVEENILKLDKAKLGFTGNDIRNMIVSTLLDENFTTELKTAILNKIEANNIDKKKNKMDKKE